ncbi:transmembrane protein 56 isoform X2 [Amborella trichopoda]|uniref:TLC domain-containing protein n=2 Tax=Amborella trichopoda TaxID=13333 RepID=W1PBB5_AMBTC|nr:transmembrane protein 56 isoform X2 [Amborella trichopoda]XP_020521723.1 transmembrane protein 56 isoform X2 [Amborella trichopoda]ERN04320.1 hypothetical protein AMTR_s00077p00190680 [Amborella trichopoda]|eukprot:XP_006842645.1 transmembrane protein 56 isoform X2 [Amborella trichopoda]
MEGLSYFQGTRTLNTLSDQTAWVLSVFAGILMCKIVYEITNQISLLFFKAYGKLRDSQKIEWCNRGISTAHAIIVSIGALYLLLFSDLFQDRSHDDLIVYRHSTLSNMMLGASIGYFLSDLGMILWLYPTLGGKEYVLHHGLSMFSIILSLVSGQGQIYILMVLFSESTTPFVNLRWYLDVAGQKSLKLYLWNGFALFLGWLVCRILLFVFFFWHMYIHFDQVKKISSLGFYSLHTVPPILALMNVFWFWKILKGLIKTISKSRHQS